MGDAAVGMHGALGRPRGAGGVDQDGEIIGAAACDHLVPQRLAAHHVIAAERHELGERHHHRIGKAAEAFHVEHDDRLQGRTARAAGQDLVELLFVLGEDHPRAGIIDEVFDLDRRIGRIDAGRNAAGAQDAHVGIHPFRHRVGDDRGDIARAGSRWRAVRRRFPSISAATAASWSAARCRTSSRGSPACRRAFPPRAENSSRSCRRPSALPVRPCSFPPSPHPLRMPALAGLFPKQSPIQRHVFFFFQRRSPRAPASLAPR